MRMIYQSFFGCKKFESINRPALEYCKGANISSFLNMLYLNDLDSRFLTPLFQTQGILLRHADDYMFVTEQKEVAEKFRDMFLEGFPTLNLKANRGKVCVFASNGKESCFTWSGLRINVLNGDISPDYDSLYSKGNLWL